MKRIMISAFAATLACLAGTGTASAQEDGMLVIPVELFACSYNDRKGPADLEKVIARWSTWADNNAVSTYAAWTLTPYYYGPEQDFDVIWLGAGTNAVELGKAQDRYLATNGGVDAAFREVVTCDAHNNFASVNYKMPPQNATPQDSVLTFSDCKFKDGATFTAVSAAMAEWSQYLADHGSNTGIWHWYPVYGGGQEAFDFKWLEAHSSLEAMGGDYEIIGNGGGFITQGRLMGHLIDCDSSRVYLAKSRRFVQLR